jgi:hypothetical protein
MNNVIFPIVCNLNFACTAQARLQQSYRIQASILGASGSAKFGQLFYDSCKNILYIKCKVRIPYVSQRSSRLGRKTRHFHSSTCRTI